MSAPRILLVGAGTMGSLHARVVATSDRAELAGVVDPFEGTGQGVASRFDVPWLRELSSLDDVQGVVIAAPTEAHAPLARQVLEAGVPLLVEKPVTDDLDTTREIVALSADRGIPLMCGLLERFNPAIVTARALLDDPVYISVVRHSPYAPRIRTGVGWDLLIHDVDLAIRTFGARPELVTGSTGRFHPSSVAGAEDVAEGVLCFSGDRVGHVSSSRIGQRKVRSATIYELSRSIEIDMLRRDVTIYHHVSDQPADEDGRGYRQQTVIEIPELVTSREPLAAQLDRFLDLVEDADADEERDEILPPHEVVAVLRSSGSPAGHPDA